VVLCYLDHILKFFTQHKKKMRGTHQTIRLRELMAELESVTSVTRIHKGEAIMYIHTYTQVNQ